VAEYTEHLYCDTYPYVTPAELIACCKDASGMAEDDWRVLDAIEDASLVLYYLTGKQFAGTCRTTIRPSCFKQGCHCCTPHQINLGVWPVTDLISVRYQGTTYTGTELDDTFHINDWHYIARNDNEPLLNGNQWAEAGSADDNTNDGYVFEVTVDHGIQIPNLLKRATRDLACQFVSVCCDKPCKLPERVTSVSRVGVAFDVASVTDLLAQGRTGLYTVDLAIQTFNPSKLQSPSFAWHPELTYSKGRRINT
jgi:hypothetical protein